MDKFCFFLVLLLFSGIYCTNRGWARQSNQNPLVNIMSRPALQKYAALKEELEIQVIFTRINRDKNQHPHFFTWTWNLDTGKYFYPASTVKLPVALLALEKLNLLRKKGFPNMGIDTPYLLDSVRAGQQTYRQAPDTDNGWPTIARDIGAIFAISENEAYNHLFDFVGRAEINTALRQKGYAQTCLLHRFYSGHRDQRFAQPISFYSGTSFVYQEGEKLDQQNWKNPQSGLMKGLGYLDSNGDLIHNPFDFTNKNWFTLTDMETMLRAALFPETMAKSAQFDIAASDYKVLHRAMGMFPREFDCPRYNKDEYWDSYVKFLVLGDSKAPQNGKIRIFNKVGEAYGTLTDIAYIVDFEANVEFILGATILCNKDGIFNDDRYDYDETGFPFLAALGREVLEMERQRPKKIEPDLSYWKSVCE